MDQVWLCRLSYGLRDSGAEYKWRASELKIETLIQHAERAALSKVQLSREMILRLLAIDPESGDADRLGAAARRVASAVTGDQARVWASIGVDYKPCSMNCRFCSFGEAWGASQTSYSLSNEEILTHARQFVESGADWITLRTTEDYGFQQLTDLAKQIRAEIPGNYRLVANTGEMNATRARELWESGFEIIYHAIRLREGLDTPFSIEAREKTLEMIGRSPLELACLVEPLGPEHTDEEIADTLLLGLKHNAKLSGVMTRVPVPGSPLYDLGQVSERRLAQVIAVTRLAAGYQAPDICVHLPSRTALEWGANVMVVDIGAIPRATGVSIEEWNHFDVRTARSWFNDADYAVD